MKHVLNFYDAQDYVIILFKDYSTKMHSVRYESTHEKGLQKLSPKQMLQRLTCTKKSR